MYIVGIVLIKLTKILLKRIILSFFLIISTNISFGQVNSISNTYRDNSTLIVQTVGGNNYNFIELSNNNEIK